MKILHFADVHARDRDMNEIEKCLDFIVTQAPGSDLIICAGDVFNSAQVKLDSRAAKTVFPFFKKLADIAPVAVISGTPSHEGNATDLLSHIKAHHNIWVSNKPEQIYLMVDPLLGNRLHKDKNRCHAAITMIPAPTKQYFETESDIKGADSEIAQAMAAMLAGFGAEVSRFKVPHVLVGHFNVTGSLVSETQSLTGVDIELSKEQLALTQADLICLGHIHKAQQIGKNIFFPGSTQAITWGELDPKGFYIHYIQETFSNDPQGHPINSEFIETPSKKLVRIDHDFTTKGLLEDDYFESGQCFDHDGTVKNGAVVRIDYKVFTDEAEKIAVKDIKQHYIEAGAEHVEINLIRIPRINVRSKKLLDLEELRDKIVERSKLLDHTVTASILAKADRLDREPPEMILEGLK